MRGKERRWRNEEERRGGREGDEDDDNEELTTKKSDIEMNHVKNRWGSNKQSTTIADKICHIVVYLPDISNISSQV